MAFTAVAGNVPLQPGTQALNMLASGAITRGQAVSLIGGTDCDNQVGVPPNASSQRLFGVAAYTVATGEEVAIYGPGNLVTVQISGAATAGSKAGLYDGGMISTAAGVKYSSMAVITKGTTATGEGEILILSGH